jgi:hypothetical protein
VKKFVAFCLLVITPGMLSAQNAATNPEPKIVKLERGQVLDLSLVTPFDSGHANVGDAISFKLERDLKADQLTVLPKNWVIHGRITHVVRAGKNCKEGRVRWELEPVTTASGRKIKVQSIPEYLAKPGGTVADRVSLDTTGHKTRRVEEYIEIAPVLVIFSPIIVPWFILMAIAMSGEGDCHGTPGREKSVLPGTHFYFAVSKDMRLVQSSASPRRCDTPETVTDSPISSTRCD